MTFYARVAGFSVAVLRSGDCQACLVAGFPTLGYLPQYLSFFVLGIIASRGNWFRTISGKTGKFGLIMALAATVLMLPIALTGLSPRLTTAANNIVGKGHWQSAVYAL